MRSIYSLRHVFFNKAHPAQLGALRHWIVRARAESTDPWVVLKTHKDDFALTEQPYATASWLLVPDNTPWEKYVQSGR